MRQITPLLWARLHRPTAGSGRVAAPSTFQLHRYPERVKGDPAVTAAAFYAAFKAGGGRPEPAMDRLQSPAVQAALRRIKGVRQYDGVWYLDGCASCFQLADDLVQQIATEQVPKTATVSCPDCLSEWRIREEMRPVS